MPARRGSPRQTRAGVKRQHSDEEDQALKTRTPPSAAIHVPIEEQTQGGAAEMASNNEAIEHDDLCPVCQLLLFNPVVTGCRHTLCKSCMAQWAEVSLSAPMTIVSVDEEARDFDAATGLDAKCPMCRTETSASLDSERAATLRSQYPATYAERETEEAEDDETRESIQTMTLYIGNRHELVEPREEGSSNMHQWTFFVRPSRRDIIEEVQIFLHPTFRPSRVIRTRPPYEIRRLGWGYFTITAGIILKAGYSWVSSDAEDSPDGASNGMLRMDWMLDFSSFGGTGAMGRCRLKVKNDRDWRDVSDEEERDEAEWARMVRQYQRDGRYEPPEE